MPLVTDLQLRANTTSMGAVSLACKLSEAQTHKTVPLDAAMNSIVFYRLCLHTLVPIKQRAVKCSLRTGERTMGRKRVLPVKLLELRVTKQRAKQQRSTQTGRV